MCGLGGSCAPEGNVPPSSPCSAAPSCEPVCSWESGRPASPDTGKGCTRLPVRKQRVETLKLGLVALFKVCVERMRDKTVVWRLKLTGVLETYYHKMSLRKVYINASEGGAALEEHLPSHPVCVNDDAGDLH